jgi:hypothetical protein
VCPQNADPVHRRPFRQQHSRPLWQHQESPRQTERDKAAHEELTAELEEELKIANLNLLMSSKLVGKDQKGITIKLSPDYSKYFKFSKTD